MANILPEILVILRDSIKHLKVESWTPSRIIIRYPLIINFKITLLAEHILPDGMFFPIIPTDWTPEYIAFRFWGVKFTIMKQDIIDFLIKKAAQ